MGFRWHAHRDWDFSCLQIHVFSSLIVWCTFSHSPPHRIAGKFGRLLKLWHLAEFTLAALKCTFSHSPDYMPTKPICRGINGQGPAQFWFYNGCTKGFCLLKLKASVVGCLGPQVAHLGLCREVQLQASQTWLVAVRLIFVMWHGVMLVSHAG